MKPNDIFSIRDFFNYYLAGVLWFADIVGIFMLCSKLGTPKVTLANINTSLNEANTILATFGVVVVPYLLGFILNPLGTKLMEKIRNKDNEAIRWVTDPNHRFASQGLKEWEKEKIREKFQKIYNIQDRSFEEMFFTIRTYVEEHGKGANFLASRALDLANFAESLAIPVPLLFVILGIWFAVSSFLWLLASLVLAKIVFWLLLRRYLDLRSYWVKHVYRAFITINVE
ncbi:MAG: hypothetical protein HRF47_09330 [Chloroflexota bacterium]|jgi:hypothetical protein